MRPLDERVRAAALAARDWAAARRAVYEQRLAAVVAIDSGFDAPAGRDEAAALLAQWAEQAGCEVALVRHPPGDHLQAVLRGDGGARVVLLGHHDTVFPAGTAQQRPYRADGDVAYGPGVADMKGGLLVGLMAMESLAQGPRGFGTVELHSVPDEEVRTTPFATIDSVAAADAALVLECGRENGDVVSGRKTGAWVRMTATGKAAHAGTEPENGRSAIIGLCRELSRCHALNGAKEGLTVNAGVISGGTIANVVPEWAEATLDVRTPRLADFQWAMKEIARVDPMEGVQVRVEDAGTWPGIEPGPAGRILLREAQVVAEVLGFAVAGQTTGGMSDGCWTAARGTPTLDGLGPIGGQDHSPREYARLDSVPSRCGLVAGLCAAIGGGLLAGAADPEGVTDTQLQ